MASSLAVKAISEELGVYISESIDLNDVAKDAESYVTSILELANRLRKHKSSKVLRVNDLNDALASRLARPLYGYKSNRVSDYKSIGVLNDNEILTNTDHQIPLNEITTSSLERYPIDTSFSFHWLAINGIEPQIEENSCITKVPGLISPSANAIPEQTKFPDQRVLIIQSKLMVSKELQNFYIKCQETIQKQVSTSSNAFIPEFKILVKTLSKEASIQPLLKFFLRNITDTITITSRNIHHLNVALTLAKSLFSNQNLENETFLLTYMSITTTLLISRYPFEEDFGNPQIPQKEFEKCYSIDQSIAIRNSASDFLGIIISKYSSHYPHLHQKMAEFLTNIIFDNRIPLISQYGAILGLQRIDLTIVRSTLIPSIDIIVKKTKKAIYDVRNKSPSIRKLAVNLNNTLLRLCGMCYKHDLSNNMKADEIEKIYSKVMLFYGNDFITFTF